MGVLTSIVENRVAWRITIFNKMLSCVCVGLQLYVKLSTFDVVLYPLRQVIFHLGKSNECIFFKLLYLAAIPSTLNYELYFSLSIIRDDAVPYDPVVEANFLEL